MFQSNSFSGHQVGNWRQRPDGSVICISYSPWTCFRRGLCSMGRWDLPYSRWALPIWKNHCHEPVCNTAPTWHTCCRGSWLQTKVYVFVLFWTLGILGDPGNWEITHCLLSNIVIAGCCSWHSEAWERSWNPRIASPGAIKGCGEAQACLSPSTWSQAVPIEEPFKRIPVPFNLMCFDI